MSILSALILITLLIVATAFVSCAELGLASASKIKLQVIEKEGDKRATDVINMQQQPGSFITIVQILYNGIAISAGGIGEAAISPYFVSLFSTVFPQNIASIMSSIVSFLLVTSSFILLADLMPKRFAMIVPEKVAIHMVRPMLLMIFILKPLVWLFDSMANAIFKMLNIQMTRQDQLTSEDIYAVVDAGAQAGVLKKQEHYLIENIFEMQERTVASTMSTREYIVYFDQNATIEEVFTIILEKPHNRFLVCNKSLENVIGYIEAHTFLALYLQEKEISLNDKRILHKPLFIPDTLSLYDVLETFKNSGEDFAVVVNEYALVVGVVTLKDVMSIVMGELVNSEEEPQIIRRSEDSWLIDGTTPLEDVVRVLDIADFPNPEYYETVAGFMMYSLRKIPKITDNIIYYDYKFEVVDIDNLKVDQILVTKLQKNKSAVEIIKPIPNEKVNE